MTPTAPELLMGCVTALSTPPAAEDGMVYAMGKIGVAVILNVFAAQEGETGAAVRVWENAALRDILGDHAEPKVSDGDFSLAALDAANAELRRRLIQPARDGGRRGRPRHGSQDLGPLPRDGRAPPVAPAPFARRRLIGKAAMHPFHHAAADPHKPAYIMAETGEIITYGELDARSNQGAHLFRSLGLKAGDGVAFFLDNGPRYYELLWAAQRSGLRFTCISSKLTAGEVEYIVQDSDSKVLVVSNSLKEIGETVAPRLPGVKLYMVDGATPPFESLEDARAPMPTTPVADETAGSAMLYSSGTTGRPKGVKRGAAVDPRIDAPNALSMIGAALYGMSADSIYLSPAPLYHAAPLGWSMAVQALGGTVVMMQRFDPERALEFIEIQDQHRPVGADPLRPHAEAARGGAGEIRRLVPEGRVPRRRAVPRAGEAADDRLVGADHPRILRRHRGQRLHRHQFAGMAGAPGLGGQGPERPGDDLQRGGRGSARPRRRHGVLRRRRRVRIPQRSQKDGGIKEQARLVDAGRRRVSGRGRLLYLTDRKSFMIISGGVNIYPAEIENLLITHPKVADVAVIGGPHEEMGEEVIAVIQPLDWSDAGDDLAADLNAFARANLSHVKAPRRIDFMAELPRHATGKLYKRLIRDAYWGKTAAAP